MNQALLIIDVQEEYIGDRREEPLYKETFEYINYVSGLFRKKGKKVIVVRHIEGEDTKGMENVNELMLDGTETEVIKSYGNSFWKTDLEKMLREDGTDFLVLCGNAAEFCVLATYNGAIERGFRAAILQNGVFAATDTGLRDIAFNRPVISYQAIEYMLDLQDK